MAYNSYSFSVNSGFLMINRFKKDWVIHILCLFLTLFYLWGMNLVPFHPDESTQIFMSQDPFDFIKDPLSLSYSPDTELTSKMTYRAIDMPLTRYLIGFARLCNKLSGVTFRLGLVPDLGTEPENWCISFTDLTEYSPFYPYSSDFNIHLSLLFQYSERSYLKPQL